jgi:hypothetical protein
MMKKSAFVLYCFLSRVEQPHRFSNCCTPTPCRRVALSKRERRLRQSWQGYVYWRTALTCRLATARASVNLPAKCGAYVCGCVALPMSQRGVSHSLPCFTVCVFYLPPINRPPAGGKPHLSPTKSELAVPRSRDGGSPHSLHPKRLRRI